MGAAAAIALAALGPACTANRPVESDVKTSAALTGPQTFTIPLPNAAGLAGIGLAASDNLKLADRVAMTSPRTGSVTAVSTGATATDVGTDATPGTIISQGLLTVRDRSVANGDLVSAGLVKLVNGGRATGVVRQNTPITPLQTFTWTVTFPAAGADVLLAPNATRTLSAGSYGNVTINSGAILHLGAGTYFLNALGTEPSSQIVLDAGPVFLYIASAATLKGAIVPGLQQRHFLIGLAGTGTTFLESPFIGTIVAPNGTLRFAPSSPAIYTGSFFAKDIDVEPMSTIALDTFADWGRLFPLPDPRPIDIHPVLNCVAPQGGGTFRALFGYFSDAFESLRVRIGAQNQFAPAPAGRGQVQRFQPGKVAAAFAATFNGAAMTWTTAGGSVTASSASPVCPTTACTPACAAGEACVGGSCVTLCGDGLCAGDEGCDTCAVDCACGAGNVCFHNGCANPVQCGVEWQCGAGTSFDVSVDCGACAAGHTCVNHLCQ
jgi:hypothetical protein